MDVFFYYDLIFFIAFSVFVVSFLYKRRKKVKREGLIFLYRTKFGIRLINKIGSCYTNILNALSGFVIFGGYVLMILMLLLFVQLFRTIMILPPIKVPPIFPLIPYLPTIFKIDFLPPFYFTYWIISIAILAIVHEFCHGIFAKHAGVKIKSTGFGFLGPFLAAFVEPDEKALEKKPMKKQLAMLSAGSMANFTVMIFFLIIMQIFFVGAFEQSGVYFSTYITSTINRTDINIINNQPLPEFLTNQSVNNTELMEITIGEKKYFASQYILEQQEGESEIVVFDDTPALRAGLKGAIIRINNESIKNLDNLVSVMSNYKAGEKISIETTEGNYSITLQERPDGEGGYIGIGFSVSEQRNLFSLLSTKLNLRNPFIYYKPKILEGLTIFIYNLFLWLVLINLSVALVNMLPFSIFDGGRVFFLTVLAITQNRKKSEKIFKIVNNIILLALAALMILWWIRL